MHKSNIFNINNALGRNRKISNSPMTHIMSSRYINELDSILEDSKTLTTISKDLYKGIDMSNKDITAISEEFYKFYNKTNIKIREMSSSIVSEAVSVSALVSSTIERSSNNIQKYLDHINKKPDDYEYRATSFKYTFNKELPIMSDIIELGNDIDINADTNMAERYNNHDARISSGSHMNLVRGSIAGMYGTEITMDEFRDVLYASYRNGTNEVGSTTFTKQDLINSCSTLLSHLGSGQAIVDTAQRIEREVVSVLSKIDELNRSDFVSDLESDDISLYYSYLYNKLIELVEIFTMVRIAFSVQLEAYSESYLNRLDIIRSHYNSGGIVTPPSNILESVNNIFFITEMEEQRIHMNRAISEATALSLEETCYITTNLRVINENYVDKTKAMLGRLMARIKNLWDKFIEKVNNLIKTDEKYLKKYKSVILDRPMEKGTFEMYDFPKGVLVMKQAQVPAFNYAALKDSLETEETFIDAKFSDYKKKDLSFTDGCKLVFRGSDEKRSFDTADLNIKEMYDFCLGYKKMTDSIKSSMTNLEKAGNEAIKIVDAIDVNTESVVYSSLRRSVIYEEDDNPTVTKGKTDDKSTERDADGKARSNNDDNKSSDIDRITNYMKVTQNFLGCKMTVMQEVYKGYMFIIREHIKNHTGTRDTSKKQSKGDPDMKNVKDDTEDAKNVKANFLS